MILSFLKSLFELLCILAAIVPSLPKIRKIEYIFLKTKKI
jgi:hypothetical protein